MNASDTDFFSLTAFFIMKRKKVFWCQAMNTFILLCCDVIYTSEPVRCRRWLLAVSIHEFHSYEMKLARKPFPLKYYFFGWEWTWWKSQCFLSNLFEIAFHVNFQLTACHFFLLDIVRRIGFSLSSFNTCLALHCLQQIQTMKMKMQSSNNTEQNSILKKIFEQCGKKREVRRISRSLWFTGISMNEKCGFCIVISLILEIIHYFIPSSSSLWVRLYLCCYSMFTLCINRQRAQIWLLITPIEFIKFLPLYSQLHNLWMGKKEKELKLWSYSKRKFFLLSVS